MSTPASTYTATSTGLTAFSPWNPDALIRAGLILFLAGALLLAVRTSH